MEAQQAHYDALREKEQARALSLDERALLYSLARQLFAGNSVGARLDSEKVKQSSGLGAGDFQRARDALVAKRLLYFDGRGRGGAEGQNYVLLLDLPTPVR
jgi:hypothetical protein